MSEAIKNKLSSFEVPPPVGVWNRISSALDQENLEFPAKLLHYEQPPPKNVWEKIAYQLDKNKGGQVVPFRKYKKSIGYALAAAVVAAFVIFSWPMFKAGDENIPEKDMATSTPVVQKPDIAKDPKENSPEEIIPPPRDPERNFNYQENKAAVAAAFKKRNEEPKDVIPDETIAMLDYVPTVSLNHQMHTLVTTTENYMIYLDEEGDAMKLPKKLYDAFECATKELICRQKIRDLQQRFASSAFNTDFTGVLEILRSLQENP